MMCCVCGTPVVRLCTVLLVNLSLWGKLSAFIAQHCENFDEYQLTDMGQTIPCPHKPGLGPYAECNVTNLKKDLMEAKPGVRTLCIYQHDLVIHTGAFSRFHSLKYLHIWGLNIKKVHSDAFTDLPNLVSLFLLFHDTMCREVFLDTDAFRGLERLEELDVLGLKLHGMTNGTFRPLLGIVSLHLKYTCSSDLGDIFCLLPTSMPRLRNLTLDYSGISSIRSQHTREWPVGVLSGVNVLSLLGTPVDTIEADSLKVFQNLTSLTLDFQGKTVSSIWESGIGQVRELQLNGDILRNLQVDFIGLCHLVSYLRVKSLTLNYVQAETLYADDVGKCENFLEELLIWNSKILKIDLRFWSNLTNLVALDMVHLRLNKSNLCSAQYLSVSSLTSLNLERNRLTTITANQFSCLPKVEILDLSFNFITTLEEKAFKGLTFLRILRLTHNNISKLNADDFRWLPALEVLNIDQNSIGSIENGVFRKQRQLQELRLGKLDIIYVLKINMIFYGIPPKLRYLNIDAGYGTNFEMSSEILPPNSTVILQLHGDLLECFLCDNAFFKAVRELKVNSSQFTCKSEFMVRYFPNLESFEFQTRIDKVTIQYTGINTLKHLKRLKLTNLNFAKQTDPAVIFHNLTKLQILVLVNCRLTFLTRDMFQNLTALRVLRLYSASPLLLLDGVFEALTSLTTVVFDKVDFRCDCENSWLLTWAERSIQSQVIFLQRQECVWHYKRLNFLSTMERLCQTDVEYVCYFGSALTISFLMATALGYHFGRWPFLVLFFRVRGWLDRRNGHKRKRRRRGRGMDEDALVEEEEENEVQFDAFVSFSSRDEAWVLGELAPRLEEQGEPRLKLCLHNRDFEVGKGIVDNIAESIYSSRRTVCVLSRRYLRSDWCALELRVATHRLLAEQRHRLIIIFLEHISPFELSAFHRLAKLVKSRTYLDWPENEAERVNFWERLRRNIAEEDRDAPGHRQLK